MEAAKTSQSEQEKQVRAVSVMSSASTAEDDDGVTIHDAATSGDARRVEKMLHRNADLVT